MAYRLSARADQDLVRLYVEGVQQFGAAQAEEYYASLRQTFELLAEFPEMARVRPELPGKVRVYPFQSHVVIYRIDERDVFIVRVRHGREDWLPRPD